VSRVMEMTEVWDPLDISSHRMKTHYPFILSFDLRVKFDFNFLLFLQNLIQ
jgi:hypothetical protein